MYSQIYPFINAEVPILKVYRFDSPSFLSPKFFLGLRVCTTCANRIHHMTAVANRYAYDTPLNGQRR